MQAIENVDKTKCTGCFACADACPVDAIRPLEDMDGFLRPHVVMDACVNCGRCMKVCPALSDRKTVLFGEYAKSGGRVTAYAAASKNEEEKKKSASGGIFPLLARAVIKNGGAIVGAVYCDGFRSVRHIMIEDERDIEKMQSSKYAQSDVRGIYKKVKALLEAGRMVLFTGTPCQAAGLDSYLGETDRSGLIIADLFCHGVSSPGSYRQYIDEIADGRKVTGVDLRDKENGWDEYGVRIRFEEGDDYFSPFREDPFIIPFIRNVSLRESCYHCRHKGFPRKSDLTLGDCWTIDSLFPDMNDHRGVSVIFANTEKGKLLLKDVSKQMEMREISFEKVCDLYEWSGKPVARPKGRNTYFVDAHVVGMKKAAEYFKEPPAKENMMNAIREAAKKCGVYGILRAAKRAVKR